MVEVALQSFICNILVLILDTMFRTLVTCILELLWGLQLPKKKTVSRAYWNDYRLNEALDYLLSPSLHVELLKKVKCLSGITLNNYFSRVDSLGAKSFFIT